MFNKIAIVCFPSMELERPPAAVGILVAICKSLNRDVCVYDLNLKFYNDLTDTEWRTAEKYWRLRQHPGDELLDKINSLFKQYIQEIDNYHPDMLALSVFTLMNNKATHEFLKLWKQNSTSNSCIIAGGQGIGTPYKVDFEKQDNVLLATTDVKFGSYLKDNNLIDHYVIGDGEDVFINALNNNFNFPGVDGQAPVQLEDLNLYPIPDYTLTDPNNYKYTADAGVYVTATRGCVRKCNFCDVPHKWPKFKHRNGKSVALEIFTQWQRHGVNVFQLTDSVVNGNLREFLSMNHALIRYKRDNPGMKNLKLLGQFNVRPKKQMTETQYRAMADAGWKVLVAGIESGSERVRMSMGKDFTNEDLDWHFYQCAKWGIQNVCLMFVGYPSETIEDHQTNVDFLTKYQKYMLAGTIAMIRWGYTGSLDSGSKLASKDLGFNIEPQIPDLDLTHLMEHDQYWIYGRNWVNLNNPTLTFEERIRRRLELHEKSVALGWPVTRPKEELLILKKIVDEFKQVTKVKTTLPIFSDIGDH